MEKDAVGCQTLRKEIMETARSLFTTKGFEQTSLGDITKELNISDKIVFTYFKSVDEILEVVWSES